MYCMTMARREAALAVSVQTIEGLQLDPSYRIHPEPAHRGSSSAE